MKKGYTLVEILIVVAIVSIISGGIFMSLTSSIQAWDSLGARTALQLELRKSILRISDDLRQTSMDQIFSNSDMTTKVSLGGIYTALYFNLPQEIGPTGAISWNTIDPVIYTLINGTIIRTRGTTSSDICSSIVSLKFTVLANDVIRIEVSGEKVKAVYYGNTTVNATMASAAAVRNRN